MHEAYSSDVDERTAYLGSKDFDSYCPILFNSIDTGFCVIEVIFNDDNKPVDYSFLIVNPAFEKHTGLKNAIGRCMRELVPAHEQHWFDIFGQVATTGEPLRFEQQASAMGRWYDVYAFRVGDPADHHVAILFEDISVRKRAERELTQSVERLHEANEKLEEGNSKLDDFVYIVSHDLKEPVRGINNFSRFILEDYNDLLDDDGKYYLNTLVALSGRMNDMISDLLKYSRASRSNVQAERFCTNELVREVLDLMKIELENENVVVNVSENLPTVYCAKAHMSEIMRNLLANAIKYNKSNPKKIEIGYLENDERHPEGIFFVKDNGIGVPEKERESIFKMFRRLHGREEFGGGTGSGLAIVKKLVEQHHGKVWVEANPDGGSIFYFYTDCAPTQ